jgi:ligand-binding sensor domain-containing protein/DNA-binding CsgD family transcriptional regulator
MVSLSCFSAPIWQQKVVNYERNQYRAGFQNWDITQATDNGWIYVANSNGLLEFDGTNWTLHPVRNKIVRSVHITDDKIYIGGSSEFGYFMYDPSGRFVYKSLSENTQSRGGGEVWNILTKGNKIYFVSDRHVHITDRDNFETVTINVSFKIDCSAMFNDLLYMGTTEGIFFLSDNNAVALSEPSKVLTGEKIVGLNPYNGKLLVTTARSGLYIINNGDINKISSVADNFIADNQLFCTSVSDGKIALGSVQNGAFLFSLDHPFYYEMLDIDNGLKNNTALSSFFDRDGNLWLGLDKGISYINLHSPVRPMYSNISPIGTGYCSMIYNNELYLGTNQALYKYFNGECRLIKGSEGQIWSLNGIDGCLFSSGDYGILVISPQETYRINLTGVWETKPLKNNKNRLIAATYSGLSVLEKRDGRWDFSHNVNDFYDSVRGFMEDEEENTFWTAITDKVRKIKLDRNLAEIIEDKTYNLPVRENVFFRMIDNHLVVCAANGIYRYDRITDSFDHYEQLEQLLEGKKYYDYLYIDCKKNIWYVYEGRLKMLPYFEKGYTSKKYNWGLSDELIAGYENVSAVDSGNAAIVAVDNAFEIILLRAPYQEQKPFNVSVRSIKSIKNDSILQFGKNLQTVELPYSQNSVRIYFTAADFVRTSDILYSCRLKGLDYEWSPPSINTSKEYTNLSEGYYVFEVKAFIDGNEEAPQTATFNLIIRPPWYRTLVAYISYLLILILTVFILYRKIISRQKKIIHRKEEELAAQSKSHEEETKIKDREIYRLQNENLQNELKYKSQELNGYILNMIRKNEMLEEVKKNAVGISKAIDEERDTGILRQKVVRLISRISSNIEHDNDFEVFKSNFDLIHKDFFKLLDEKFPGLTRNEKILCAYLKMNLSTKEIAPLQNISSRGVEVNRYRLRKKMNLDRDVNLSKYLNELK